METALKLQNSTTSWPQIQGPELILQVFLATEHISTSLRFLFAHLFFFHSIETTFLLTDRRNIFSFPARNSLYFSCNFLLAPAGPSLRIVKINGPITIFSTSSAQMEFEARYRQTASISDSNRIFLIPTLYQKVRRQEMPDWTGLMVHPDQNCSNGNQKWNTQSQTL